MDEARLLTFLHSFANRLRIDKSAEGEQRLTKWAKQELRVCLGISGDREFVGDDHDLLMMLDAYSLSKNVDALKDEMGDWFRDPYAPEGGYWQDGWDDDYPDREWLIDHRLAVGELTLFAGHGSIGKSRLALQLAGSLAAEREVWLPRAKTSIAEEAPRLNDGGVCMFASWEDDRAETARRLKQAGLSSAVGQRLIFSQEGATTPLWKEGGEDGLGQPTGRMKRLLDDTYAVGAVLLVIDPAAAAYGSDENSRQLVRAFLGRLSRWAQSTKCAVLLISHPPKTAGAIYSGSTDWWNAPRSVWSLTWQEFADPDFEGKKKSDAPRLRATRLRWEKSNYGLAHPTLSDCWLQNVDGAWAVALQHAAAQPL